MVKSTFRRKADLAVWKLRYWTLDKYHGQLRLLAFWIAGVIATVWLLSKFAAQHAAQHGAPEPQRMWVQIVIMIVIAILAYALMPKPKPPEQSQRTETPVTKDGKSMRRIYGTVWTSDPAMLAWKNGRLEPIRKKGGK